MKVKKSYALTRKSLVGTKCYVIIEVVGPVPLAFSIRLLPVCQYGAINGASLPLLYHPVTITIPGSDSEKQLSFVG